MCNRTHVSNKSRHCMRWNSNQSIKSFYWACFIGWKKIKAQSLLAKKQFSKMRMKLCSPSSYYKKDTMVLFSPFLSSLSCIATMLYIAWLLILISCTLNDAKPIVNNAIRLPLIRKSTPHIRKRAATSSKYALYDQDHVEYLTKVNIGTPPQEFLVTVDTGR